jgi:plasmid stabilization system protein ParE
VRIDLNPLAFEELKSSANWYSRRSPIAGQKFSIAVAEALKKISDDPDRFVKVDGRHCACRVLGFPFQIVFRIQENRVRVVAVAHAKRRLGYWKRRR